jgi:hypothetical protein
MDVLIEAGFLNTLDAGFGENTVFNFYFLSALGTSGWCHNQTQHGCTPIRATRARTLLQADNTLFIVYTSFKKRLSAREANRWPASVKVNACHQVPKLIDRTRVGELPEISRITCPRVIREVRDIDNCLNLRRSSTAVMGLAAESTGAKL